MNTSTLQKPVDGLNDSHKGMPVVVAPRSMVRMSLQTREATRLLQGRPAKSGKPAIIGLFGFADRLRMIWDFARQENPYAIWWLLRVEAECERAQQTIDSERVKIDARLSTASEFDIDLSTDAATLRVDLNFACPYAFRAAQLLAKFDRLAHTALMAERLALMTHANWLRNRFRCERAIRRLFCAANGFQDIPLSSRDVLEGTAHAIAARESMGQIPQSILNGEQWPGVLAPAVAPADDNPPVSP